MRFFTMKRGWLATVSTLSLVWACGEDAKPTANPQAGHGGAAGVSGSTARSGGGGLSGRSGSGGTVAGNGGTAARAGSTSVDNEGGAETSGAGGTDIGRGGEGATTGGRGSRGGAGGSSGDGAGGDRGGRGQNGSSGGHGGGVAGMSELAGGQAGSGEAGADGGAAGESGAAGAPSASLSISNLVIERNPNMTISCYVSWVTDEPASSEVDFGAGSYAFRIRDTTLVTQHRVLVIGMHAATEYEIKATSATSAKSGSAEGTFTTGALPSDFPLPTLAVNDDTKTQPGWTLMNVSLSAHPSLAVIYDEDAVPVWYFVDGPNADTRGDVAVRFIGNGVLIGAQTGEPARQVDLSGAVVWEGPENALPSLETHDIGKTSTGNYLINTDYWVTIDKAQWIDAFVQELKPDLSEAWSWHLFDHQAPAGTRGDVCHGNAMTLDETNDVLYYNCRFLGLLKVDRTTGNIVWRLGGSYDTTTYGPGDFSFSPPESQFSDTHDPEVHADGTILVYDNGGYDNHSSGVYHSRVVEYQVDPAAKTATRTFEFPGTFNADAWYTSNWYSIIFGDADRLPNGNILVDAPVFTAGQASRAFEVTRQGEVVWQIALPSGFASYRAERIAQPLVERLR